MTLNQIPVILKDKEMALKVLNSCTYGTWVDPPIAQVSFSDLRAAQ